MESLEYLKNLGTGQVTFLQPGGTIECNGIDIIDLKCENNAYYASGQQDNDKKAMSLKPDSVQRI